MRGGGGALLRVRQVGSMKSAKSSVRGRDKKVKCRLRSPLSRSSACSACTTRK